MTTRPAVRLIVPAGVDDPQRVSGGNVYDRHVRDGLRRRGWDVSTVEATGRREAASALSTAPAGSLVLVDGLTAGWAAAELEEAAARVRVVVLAHMVVAAFPDAPADAVEAERRVLACASRVVVTSRWTAGELARRGLAGADRVTVAAPGVREATPVVRAQDERNLLCVGVVAPHKGQDTLLAALARLPRADWTCSIVGSAEQFRDFATTIVRGAGAFGGRVRLTGVLGGSDLGDAYRRTAVLIAPSRVESAGMAIADARARGIPVIGTHVGGIPDTVAGGGAILVRPDDPGALADAMDAWMTDPALRARLRREALGARARLPRWSDTVTRVARALEAA